MKTLTVGDLTTKDRERVKQNHETYKMLYKQCVEHIRRRNDMGSTSTTYFVSEYVLGRPLFTHLHAVRYIKEKLERGKFYVEIDPVSKALVIDWGAEKQKHIRHNAPKDLGIDMKKYKEMQKKRVKNAHVERWLSDSTNTGSKKKKKKSKDSKGSSSKKIEEPLSLRISRLNAALSVNSKAGGKK